MSRGEIDCPVCTADVPLAGDERPGEQVVCPYCGVPSRLTASPGDDECELEEDF